MTTTRGFDLAGEFRTTVPDRILYGFWRAGVLPSLIEAGNIAIGSLLVFEQLQIYFDDPHVDFENTDTPGALTAVIRQKTTFRAANRPGEGLNTLVVRARCVLRDVEIEGVQAQELALDFADDTNLTVDWEGDSQFDLVEQQVRTQVRDRFAAISRTIPVGPMLLGAPLRFFPVDGAGQLALKMFCNIDGRDGAPGDGKQDALVDPAPLKPWDPDDMAIAMDGGRLLQLANQAMTARGLVDGATLLADGGKKLIDLQISGDVTLDTNTGISFLPDKITLPVSIDFSPTLQTIKLTSPIDLSLHSGYLRASGSINAEIDNAFDVDADFDLRIGFSIAAGKATATILRADIDVDSTLYQILASLLFLPAAALIANAVDEAIDTAASDAVKGMSFSEKIPVRTFAFGNVALTDDAAQDALDVLNASSDPPPQRPVIVGVAPTKVMVREDAVVLQAKIDVQTPGAPPPVRPTYLIGHVKSKQVHQPTCKFGIMIKTKNREYFVWPQDALAAGYDGCRYCMPQFDGEGVGHLALTYTRAVGLNKKRTTPIRIEGSFVSGSKQSKFQKPWTRSGELVSSHLDGRWIDRVEIRDLAPGIWSITVTDGDWTATKKVGIAGGDAASASFVYGKDAPAGAPGVGSVEVIYRAPLAEHLKKRLAPLFEGKWQGEPMPKTETAFWTLDADVDYEYAPGVRAMRIRLFLHAGPWRISATEWGKLVAADVEIKDGEETQVVFDRPSA